jgi:hypothetical protein
MNSLLFKIEANYWNTSKKLTKTIQISEDQEQVVKCPFKYAQGL